MELFGGSERLGHQFRRSGGGRSYGRAVCAEKAPLQRFRCMFMPCFVLQRIGGTSERQSVQERARMHDVKYSQQPLRIG